MENIENYQALYNRINKLISDFDVYPLMPEGNLTIEFIENVFSFNPLFVLDDFKKDIMNILLEKTDYKYSEEELMSIVNETYVKREKELKIGVLNQLINNFKGYTDNIWRKETSYMQMRTKETILFYFAYSIFYISKDIKSISGVLFSRTVLKSLDLIHCEKRTSKFNLDGFKCSGKMLDLREFSRDRNVYEKMKSMIEKEIENSNDEEAKQELKKAIEEENKQKKGCYIATCVYGSYDCPPVWTLRRYRDDVLDSTWLGKKFIRMYYSISPVLVRFFGKTWVFKAFFKRILDELVKKLQTNGIIDEPYND